VSSFGWSRHCSCSNTLPARHSWLFLTLSSHISSYIRYSCLFVDQGAQLCILHPQYQYLKSKSLLQAAIMLSSSRAMKPKLSLSVSTSAAQSTRPSLSLKTPLRSPVPPSPMSPTVRNTQMNQRGYSTVQHPTYAYANSSSSRSILKKSHQSSGSSAPRQRQLQFKDEPTINLVTPIEEEGYYGTYAKMTREERRWQRR